MTISRILALAVFSLLAMQACAQDGDKPAQAKKEEAPVVSREEPKGTVEAKRSRGFLGFWIHSVGGTIGNGLKSGAHKINRAFKPE